MGVSYYGAVVFGVPIKAVESQTTATKYDENTGEPYVVQMKTYVDTIPSLNHFILPDVADEYYDTFREEFSVHDSTGIMMVGLTMKTVDPNLSEIEQLSGMGLEDLPDRFSILAREYYGEELGNALTRVASLHLVGYAY